MGPFATLCATISILDKGVLWCSGAGQVNSVISGLDLIAKAGSGLDPFAFSLLIFIECCTTIKPEYWAAALRHCIPGVALHSGKCIAVRL